MEAGQDKDRDIITAEPLPNEGLTGKNWSQSFLIEDPIGNVFTTRVRMFSDSILWTSPGSRLDASPT